MVWAKAGPQHNPTTDANSQVFFTVFLPRFRRILARVAILLCQRMKAMMLGTLSNSELPR